MSNPIPRAAETAVGGRQPTRIIITNGQSYHSLAVTPLLVASLSVLLIGLLTWCIGLSGFVFFRDDVVRSMMRRHAVSVEQYEDRITALRLQVDSIRSRQFINQDLLATVIDDLRARQDEIEADQSRILDVVEQARQAGIRIDAPAEANADTITTGSIAPETLDRARHSVTLAATPTIAAPSVSRPAIAPREALVFADTPDTSVTRVARQIDADLRSIGGRHSTVLNAIELQAANRVASLRSVFDRIKLDKRRFGLDSELGVGGPFIKAKDIDAATPLTLQIARVEQAIAVGDRLEERISALPINRPLPVSHGMSSSFGNRLDPFLRRRAFHSGLDFRAPTGTTVRATASGRITKAGWSGGYGRMVEVSHGNGLSTRYAHLSKVNVRVGETVSQGEGIGKVGSTGRSTGPHLHYEVHVDGKAVNPIRFLTAL